MSFRSVVAKNVVLRMVGVMTVTGAALVSVSLTNESFIRAQSPRSAAPPKAESKPMNRNLAAAKAAK